MKKVKKDGLTKIAHEITFHPKVRKDIFLELESAERARMLHRLSSKVVKDIVNSIEDEEAVALLEYLDPVDATRVARLLPDRRRNKIIEELSENLRESVEKLVKFDPKTAAGVMSTDYIQVEEDSLVKDVADKFREHEKNTGRLPVIVVQREGKLVGQMPGHMLGFGKPTEKIEKYVSKIPKISFGAARRDAINTFRHNRHSKVAVVDEDDKVFGIIYSDDIIRLLHENESASLYDFAGVQPEEDVSDPVATKVKFRYRWLIVNLGTAFLAAFTVSLFEGTISKYVLLAVYMPIVAGMGGNAATQTLAVLVRGIALRQIRLKTAWLALKRELGAGLVNGMITGLLVAGVVLVVNQDVMMALILSMAMVINLLVAAFFGTLIPLVMKSLGKDPATSATIFITTATDVLGFLAFLGLAAILLG